MKTKPRIGIYPGTFDPITHGHTDIIFRAATIVDRLVIAVAKSSGKGPLFDTAERVRMVKREVKALPESDRIDVMPFDNLLIHVAQKIGASVIVRGLRAVSDYEYEIQMAAMNYRMCPEIETIFLSATEGTQFVASSFVKEICKLGGDVRPFVSEAIAEDLERCFRHEKSRRKVMPIVRD